MANTPNVRFKGFSGEWEERRLSEYLTVSTEKNKENIFDKTDVLSVSGDHGVVNQIEFQGRSFAGVSVSNYGVVHTGDVVYTKSPLRSNPYGIIKTNKGNSGIVSTLYAVYRPKENAFADFIQTYFEHHSRMNNYMQPLVNKGAKNDMKVSSENALKGIVVFPKYEEQKKISAFLAYIEHFITLHQRKYAETKELKKYMLQKMFPQNGKRTPEIRFAGFTDAWEQRKLGEIIITYSEKNPKDKKLPVLTSSRQGIQTQEEHFGRTQNHDTSEYNVIPKGYCTYRNRSDDKTFTFNINECVEKGIVSKFYPVFSVDGGNAKFLTTYLNSNKSVKNRLAVLAVGTSQVVLSLTQLKELKILLPTEEEQIKIGEYFDNLDRLITLHQRKHDQLKEVKKFMLQNMFPQKG
ncbi:MAG: restriction endonuclease subunit S [Clostridium sp.]|nr:restriction endonuclease subunit S [Clostridium sp.]